MSPSLYARYLDERTDDKIIENEFGFITYRKMNSIQMYIVDLYILPEMRCKGLASKLADQVEVIAKGLGCTEIIGTVNPSCYGAKESILTLIAYGMDVYSSTDNIIYFKKGI